MVALKKEILTCFVGTDEWEITEYLLRADSQPRNQNGKTRPEGIRDASPESLWNVGLQVLRHWMLTAGCQRRTAHKLLTHISEGWFLLFYDYNECLVAYCLDRRTRLERDRRTSLAVALIRGCNHRYPFNVVFF